MSVLFRRLVCLVHPCLPEQENHMSEAGRGGSEIDGTTMAE